MFYNSSLFKKKFQRVISEVPLPIAAKFCVMLGSMFYFITPVQKFGGPLPYLTSDVDRFLHLPSAEIVSARPNARPRSNHKVTGSGYKAVDVKP